MTKVGLSAIGTSTPLKSNKSPLAYSLLVDPSLHTRGTHQSGPHGTKERQTWKHRRREVPRSPLRARS